MTKFASLSLLALLAFTPTAAYSEPILGEAVCPEEPVPATEERQFKVTVDSGDVTCYAYGNGANDMNGSVAQDVIIGEPGTDWVLLDKDNVGDAADIDDLFTTDFGTGGDWSIDSSLWDDYERLAIGFKVGGGGDTPIWAVFELLLDADSGEWLVKMLDGSDVSNQALSHANLYGIEGDGENPPQSVPEPASMLLVGAGLSWAARRRMTRKAGKA